MHLLIVGLSKAAIVIFGIFWLIAEEVIAETLSAGLAEAFAEMIRLGASERGWWYPAFCCLVAGGFAGFMVTWPWPHRILPHPIPGSSLIIAPLLTATILRFLGTKRSRHSALLTFRGGWFFAFGFASVRFLLITLAAQHGGLIP